MYHFCQLRTMILLLCLVTVAACSEEQDAEPRAASTSPAPGNQPQVKPIEQLTPSGQVAFEVGNTKVFVSEGTEADGRNALKMVTSFLKLWQKNDLENALPMVVPQLRNGWRDEMTKRKIVFTEVKDLRIYRGRSGGLVGRVHFIDEPDREVGMEIRLDGQTWMIGGDSPRQNLKSPPPARMPKGDSQPLSYWIDQLKPGSKGDRRGALSAILRLGPEAAPAVPVLIEALEDADESIRDGSAHALGFIGPRAKDAVPALAKAAQDKSKIVRSRAIDALGRIGSEAASAVPALVEAMKSPDASTRLIAVQSIGGIGPNAEAAVPALIETIRDPDKSLRLFTAQTLGQLGPKAGPAVPALIEAMNDPDSAVRVKAASAFVTIGPTAKAAIPALVAAVEGHDPELRRQAAYTLSVFGHSADNAVPVLIAVLKESDFNTRKQAIRTLGMIGPKAKAAIPALLEVVEQASALQLRVEAASALPRIDRTAAREALPLLLKTLKDSDSGVRITSAKAIGNIGPDAESALPALRELLDDKTVDVAQVAAEAIQRIEQK